MFVLSVLDRRVTKAVARAGMWGAMIVLTATLVTAQVPPRENDSEPLDQLVLDLGAPEFPKRERATRLLLEASTAALPKLESATHSRDWEVRSRARYLIAEIQRRERPKWLAAFVTGAQSDRDPQLPGWRELKAAAGDSPESRRLLVEILQEHWDFLDAVQTADVPQKIIAQRFARLADRRRRSDSRLVSLTDVSAIMLAMLSSCRPATCEPSLIVQVYAQLASSTRNTVSDASARWDHEPFRRLAGSFLLRTSQPQFSQMALHLAISQRLPESGTIASDILKRSNAPIQVIQLAILTTAIWGTAEDGHMLERFLTDERVCSRRPAKVADGKAWECRLQDAALATLWHLHGRDPTELGFPGLVKHTSYFLVPQTVGFTSQQDRTEALKKLEDLKASSEGTAPSSPQE